MLKMLKKVIAAVLLLFVPCFMAVILYNTFICEDPTFFNPSPIIEPMIDLTGKDYDTCKDLLEAYFELEIEREEYSDEYLKGEILWQDIKEGVPIDVNSNVTVKVIVSKGARPDNSE